MLFWCCCCCRSDDPLAFCRFSSFCSREETSWPWLLGSALVCCLCVCVCLKRIRSIFQAQGCGAVAVSRLDRSLVWFEGGGGGGGAKSVDEGRKLFAGLTALCERHRRCAASKNVAPRFGLVFRLDRLSILLFALSLHAVRRRQRRAARREGVEGLRQGEYHYSVAVDQPSCCKTKIRSGGCGAWSRETYTPCMDA